MKKKKPSAINVLPEVAEFISNLDRDSHLGKIIDKALFEMRQDIFAGKNIEKNKIPTLYMREYALNNLYVLRLNSRCRLVYTLIFDGAGVSMNIIEIFLDHKQYENRFGYAK